MEIWTVEKVRAVPSELRPKGSAVQFVGGMMDGKVKHLPTTVDDGPVPFTGYDHGRQVSHWYEVTGWRPDRCVWVYTLASAS